MVSTKAETTQKQIEEMEAKSEDAATKKKLNDCSEMYRDVTDTLKETVQSMDKKAFDDVIASLTAATNDVEACEDGFKEPPVVPSPLTAVNEMFTQFCSICLAITSTVDQ
ncbi:Putative invertase inhibitor [Linum grandiflorum]